MLLTLLKGLLLAEVAIGAQNAFMIRQSMLRRHLFMTAMKICSNMKPYGKQQVHHMPCLACLQKSCKQ